MIRWTFEYGNDLVVCRVSWQPATSTYVVSVVPNGSEEAAVTETFASGVTALAKHAALVAALRARGWKTLAYSNARPVAGGSLHRAA